MQVCCVMVKCRMHKIQTEKSMLFIQVAMPRKSRFFQTKNWERKKTKLPKRMGKVFLLISYNMIGMMVCFSTGIENHSFYRLSTCVASTCVAYRFSTCVASTCVAYRPVSPQPVLPQPVLPQPVSPQPVLPTDSQPTDSQPVLPTDSQPTDSQPVSPQPADSQPVSPQPVLPTDSQPMQPCPVSPAQALENLQVIRSSLILPQFWLEQSLGTPDKIKICKLSSEPSTSKQPLALSHCLVIHSDMTWSLFVHNRVITPTHCIPKHSNSFVKLLDQCPAHPDERFVGFIRSKKGVLVGRKGDPVADYASIKDLET